MGRSNYANFLYSLPRGKKRKLVPIVELPYLIGSPNTWSQQAMLQILILEEFSNQSVRLVQSGSVHLPLDLWKQLARQAQLRECHLPKIITAWTQDELFHKAFLDRQGDEYSLGASYSKVIKFLQHQGQQQIDGSVAGRTSAVRKKELEAQGYNTKKRKS